MTLEMFFHQHPKAALALSGGVDSSYLLYAARHWGCDIHPYFVKTAFQPAFELKDAQDLCQTLGIELTVIPLDVLSTAPIAANPPDRCYHCKQCLFTAVRRQALADGYTILLDGTNASDEAGDRPGMRALQELQVRSPLRECGITKSQVRHLAQEAGVRVWDKPAYACLATRVPAGQPLDAALLHRIECAEDALFAMGFSDFRVRIFHDAARLQLPAQQFSMAVQQAEEIRTALAPWFSTILLDLNGR